ncbi:unnamed protein product [Allacma fusca]|uniref:Histone-lysine N-methyltransferase eggless n=1 Tax=Allacma fusca TaxID=39272 RepID=A0A8J2PN87_9HEXA|nr:unnamed protein product [Allacma fusca]
MSVHSGNRSSGVSKTDSKPGTGPTKRLDQSGGDGDIEIINIDDDDVEVINVTGSASTSSASGSGSSNGRPASSNSQMPRFMKPEPFQIGDKVYGLERGLKDPWREATIESIENHFGKRVIKLKFAPGERIRNRRKVTEERVVNCRHIAYFEPVKYVIPVGCRVIARNLDKTVTGNFLFAGIVAEPPKEANKNRYLIFFDDGIASYCLPTNVRLTLSNTAGGKIWSDVHPDNQKFVRHYVNAYPQNSLAKIRLSAITTVEWNGMWWTARVKEMDCSMVKLQIIANHIVVKVWKGSPRLLSIFKENSKLVRPIALPASTNEEYEGKVVKHQIPSQYLKSPGEYKPHNCTKECWGSYTGKKSDLRKLGPLVKPFYYGWDRKTDPDDPRRQIYYQTPCGLKLYSIEDVQNFNTKLSCSIGIDCFCFDFAVQCLDEFEVTKHPFYHCVDISYGKEWVPISKINTVDEVDPPYIAYTNERCCGRGVSLNIEPEFLVCCDCVDDCTDKLKCACIRLTFENEPEFLKNPQNFSKGYQHRRLRDKYVLGIYECNQLCKCRSTCVNRVVQHGLKWKLQVFKTSSKGYAIRTLQDIPEGSFICVYTGELLSSKQANEFGGKFGDEYLANIDFIEFAEMHKEGYEETVVEPEPIPVRKAGRPKNSSKEEKKRGKRTANSKNEFINDPPQPQKANKRKRNISTDSEEEIDVAEQTSSCSKTRQLFGPDEDSEIYTIDAKCIGNIGRYLNHSCDPNVFAQDVFLDTHDIRFPWVAFFASRYLKSGTELTWDYNYEIGMAEGKTVDCNCGSAYCRRRLL